jgi:hypothetical protein
MIKLRAQGVPIDVFIERHFGDRRRALPLVDTAYDVVFEARLAVSKSDACSAMTRRRASKRC